MDSFAFLNLLLAQISFSSFDNPEFSERIDEIRKRRKQREEELEEIEKQGAFNYYLKDVGGYIREAMNQYERENKQ